MYRPAPMLGDTPKRPCRWGCAAVGRRAYQSTALGPSLERALSRQKA